MLCVITPLACIVNTYVLWINVFTITKFNLEKNFLDFIFALKLPLLGIMNKKRLEQRMGCAKILYYTVR